MSNPMRFDRSKIYHDIERIIREKLAEADIAIMHAAPIYTAVKDYVDGIIEQATVLTPVCEDSGHNYTVTTDADQLEIRDSINMFSAASSEHVRSQINKARQAGKHETLVEELTQIEALQLITALKSCGFAAGHR